MRMLAAVAVMLFGCGKGGDAPPAAPTEAKAAETKAVEAKALETKPVEPVDVPLPLPLADVTDAVLDAAYASIVQSSGGRCKGGKRELMNSSDTTGKHDDGLLIGIACGDADAKVWMVGLATHDGLTTRVVGAKQVDVMKVIVYGVKVSPQRMCVVYDTRTLEKALRGQKFCIPVDPAARERTVWPVDEPSQEVAETLPAQPTSAEILDEAHALLAKKVGDMCAPERAKDGVGLIAKDGEREIVALACGDAKQERYEIGLFERVSGSLVLLGSALELTKWVEVKATTRTSTELCASYLNERGFTSDICVVRPR